MANVKRARLQTGTIAIVGSNWRVRYCEFRNVGGTIQRVKTSHVLGPVTTSGKKPPKHIELERRRFMATVTCSKLPAEKILTVSDFVESIYLPWIERHQRPSTLKGYKQVWFQHLKNARDRDQDQKIDCGKSWLRDVRTYDVQGWLNAIAKHNPDLSRNSLRRIQSVCSGIFSLAKQQGYYDGVNPVQDTRVDPTSAEAAETYAYSLEEIQALLALLPEPAATAFAVAAFMGLRVGEIEGLTWENYRNGEMHISRSIWNGHIGAPKTRKSAAPVPVIRQLAERLEMHRLHSQNPQTGPIFANSLGKPLSMNNVLVRAILPVLNRCVHCGESKKALAHVKADPMYEGEHVYERDPRLPQWHGWHAGRRGLGSNLYRLGVPAKVIQRILRHSNVSITETYYIKSTDDDARNAMKTFELMVPENRRSELPDILTDINPLPSAPPESIN